jgi:transcriptional regulator with XRE-family HTH domain
MKTYLPRKETTLGKHLQRLRESRELSRKDLEEKSGVTYQSIYFIETGMRPPGLSVVIRMTDGLDLSLTEMLSVIKLATPADCASDREEQSFISLYSILSKLCDCDESTELDVKIIIDKNLNDEIRERSNT